MIGLSGCWELRSNGAYESYPLARGQTSHQISTETFIDELAAAAGKDPVAFRRAMLAKHPRHLGVLNLAAEKAGWGKPLPKARTRGIAVHESFNTYVAQVAEVTVGKGGAIKVERVVCAVDCGIVINPDVVRAQMEGGIGYGLSAALHGAITLKDGRVEQANFHDYLPLRMNEMPRVEVHIVQSAEKPTGVGEPGVPPIAPAVANAIAAASGQRLRNLPLKMTWVSGVGCRGKAPSLRSFSLDTHSSTLSFGHISARPSASVAVIVVRVT